MNRAVDVRARDSWRETPVDTVVLDFDDRHRRRMAMTGTRGFEFLLDLPADDAERTRQINFLEKWNSEERKAYRLGNFTFSLWFHISDPGEMAADWVSSAMPAS